MRGLLRMKMALVEAATITELWDIVNDAETLDEIEEAIQQIKASDVNNETYDELMNTLAYKSREAYHRERGN